MHGWLSRRSLPLRWLMLAPAIGILLAVLGAASWVAYTAAGQSILRLERQVTAEVASRVEHQVLEELSQPVRFATRLRDGLQRGLLRLDDDEQLRRFLLNELRQNPSLGFAAVGRADGSLAGVARELASGAPQWLRGRLDEGLTVTAVMAADDLPGMVQQQLPGFDARERPWYARAQSERRMGWYPVFVYRAQPTLGMGVSAPLLEAETQRTLGVVAVDVTLAGLSRFLAREFESREGLAFIAEPDGRLLASSLPMALAQGENATQLARRHLGESPDARLRAMPELIQAHAADSIDEPTVVRIEGRSYLFDLRRVHDAAGLDLLQGVLLEEAEFAGSVWEQARGAALSVLVIALIGTLLLAVLLRLVTRRVAAVGEAAARMAEGRREARASEAGPVREVQQLAAHFNRMGAQLQQTLDGLEHEVASRTAALEAANARLELLASLDGLTQVANRRHFDEQIQLAWRRCQRDQQPLAVLLIDVDDFKLYNDRHGHPAGDAVLQRIGATLFGLQRRADDLAARYGGEEFALLLPRADEAGAARVAGRVVSAMRSLALPHEGARAAPVVTVSVGVAVIRPQAEDRPNSSVADLLAAADAALYAAKEAGRNRFHPPAPGGSGSGEPTPSTFRDAE